MADDNNVPEPAELLAQIVNPAARAMVALAYDAHVAYAAAHYAKFGAESAGLKAWRESLPSVDLYADDDDRLAALDLIREQAVIGSDPATVYAWVLTLTDLLSTAKANLAGLYNSKDRPTGDVDPNADVASLRDTLDNLLAACVPLTATPLLPADQLWAVIPGVERKSKSGSVRTVYGGPSIPQTRQSSPIRANAKLTLDVRTSAEPEAWTSYADGNFGENVKAVLRLDMAELKAIVGEFTDANYGVTFTTPSGITFRIVKRSTD